MSDAGEAARRIVKMLETSASFPDLIEELNCWGPEICRDHQRQASEIERLRAALTECSAPYDSGPTTVLDGARLVAAEFQRRMDIAGSALSPLPAPKG